MIYLIRLDIINKVGELFRVRQIAVVKKKSRSCLVGVLVKVVNSRCIGFAD